MSIGAFLWGMRLVVLVGFMGAAGMVFSFTPYLNTESFEVNYFALGLFYLFLFMFLLGLFSIFLFRLRNIGREKEDERVNAGVSFRQGLLLSIMVLGLLVLQSFRILVWWDGLLVIGAVMMVEFYYLIR